MSKRSRNRKEVLGRQALSTRYHDSRKHHQRQQPFAKHVSVCFYGYLNLLLRYRELCSMSLTWR